MTIKYIEYVTVIFRNSILEVWSIYYEFLLQTERTHKLVKYPTEIDNFITSRYKLIETFV